MKKFVLMHHHRDNIGTHDVAHGYIEGDTPEEAARKIGSELLPKKDTLGQAWICNEKEHILNEGKGLWFLVEVTEIRSRPESMKKLS